MKADLQTYATLGISEPRILSFEPHLGHDIRTSPIRSLNEPRPSLVDSQISPRTRTARLERRCLTCSPPPEPSCESPHNSKAPRARRAES
jgi:hypothetical protein